MRIEKRGTENFHKEVELAFMVLQQRANNLNENSTG